MGQPTAAAAVAQQGTQGAEHVQSAVPAEAGVLRSQQGLAQLQRIGVEAGQSRGRALLGINLAAIAADDLHRSTDRPDVGAAGDAAGQQQPPHRQARNRQGRDAAPVPEALQAAAGVEVAQGGRLGERRSQLQGIAMAQPDGADALILPEHPIGGVEVLQAGIAIAGSLPLDNTVHAADAIGIGHQLNVRIAADPNPLRSQRQPLQAHTIAPEFQRGLACLQSPPALA